MMFKKQIGKCLGHVSRSCCVYCLVGSWQEMTGQSEKHLAFSVIIWLNEKKEISCFRDLPLPKQF